MFEIFSIGCSLMVFVLLVVLFLFTGGPTSFITGTAACNSYFMFDGVSYYLVILVLLLWVYTSGSFGAGFSLNSYTLLCLSLFFSLCCFCVKHSVIFWCFYELSMLPLLCLIFKDSPYSERFLAGWYFLCYLLITSLPLMLLLLYLSLSNNSFFFTSWGGLHSSKFLMFLILAFMFFTKVPLLPFHTWLPIVHAEATSVVSIFLSGYMMKLGLLGVYRCSYFMFGDCLMFYLFFCCLASVIFIMVACGELDGKRWLAFLSLSHMVVPFLCFFISDWSAIKLSFMFCLGHGVSAGLIFCLLWCFYDLSNSRNWLLVKSCMKSSFSMVITVFSMLTLCSFPVTMQFFCEVYLVGYCMSSMLYLFFWSMYLFLGGLAPLLLCGHLLVRSECFESWFCCSYNYYFFLLPLCAWCYMGVFIV